MSQQAALLEKQANKLLIESGFMPNGSKRRPYSKKEARQHFFERRIITTPMGNKMR